MKIDTFTELSRKLSEMALQLILNMAVLQKLLRSTSARSPVTVQWLTAAAAKFIKKGDFAQYSDHCQSNLRIPLMRLLSKAVQDPASFQPCTAQTKCGEAPCGAKIAASHQLLFRPAYFPTEGSSGIACRKIQHAGRHDLPARDIAKSAGPTDEVGRGRERSQPVGVGVHDSRVVAE